MIEPTHKVKLVVSLSLVTFLITVEWIALLVAAADPTVHTLSGQALVFLTAILVLAWVRVLRMAS